MNREIKFRAWKMRNSKMRRCVYTPFSFMKYAQTHIDEPVMRYSDVNDIQDFMPDADIIEQYTGLKDKNDKEIYEGDIVRKYSDGDIAPICGVVEFYKNGARFCVNPGHNMLTQRWEVMGNIHENPELLGGGE